MAVALLHRESPGDAKRKGVNSHAFGAPNAHTNCFMVSGSKVLEGYGKYVAIAVGEKSFNGRIMMGTYFHILSRFHIPSASIPQQPPILFVPFPNYLGFLQLPHMIWDFFNQRQKVLSGAQCAYRSIESQTRPFEPSTDLDYGLDAEHYYKSSMKKYAESVEKIRTGYHKALPDKLKTARDLARGNREPTKDDINYPPPTEVELRAERLKKELRWRGDVAGWDIIKPENPVAFDERFDGALQVFVNPPETETEL